VVALSTTVANEVVGSGVVESTAVDVELDVDNVIDVLPPPHAQHASVAVRCPAPTADPKFVLHSTFITRNEQL
jgi:hypothetical protein